MERVKTLHNAYDFIVTFLEGMVESTLDVQKENQGLLRCFSKITSCMIFFKLTLLGLHCAQIHLLV